MMVKPKTYKVDYAKEHVKDHMFTEAKLTQNSSREQVFRQLTSISSKP